MKKKVFIGSMILLTFYFLFIYISGKSSIKDYLESKCGFSKNEICEINLNEFVKQNGCRIFVFYPEISNQEISNALGFDYHSYNMVSDDELRIIISKNKQVIYEEDFWNNEIEFQGGMLIKITKGRLLNNPYYIFNNSTFLVESFKDSDSDFYLLKMR